MWKDVWLAKCLLLDNTKSNYTFIYLLLLHCEFGNPYMMFYKFKSIFLSKSIYQALAVGLFGELAEILLFLRDTPFINILLLFFLPNTSFKYSGTIFCDFIYKLTKKSVL